LCCRCFCERERRKRKVAKKTPSSNACRFLRCEKDCFQNLRMKRKGIPSGIGKTAVDPSRQARDDAKTISTKPAASKKRKVVKEELQKTSAAPHKLKRLLNFPPSQLSAGASSENESAGDDTGAVERTKPQEISKEHSIMTGMLRSSDGSMRGYSSLPAQRGATLLDNSNLSRNANLLPSHSNFLDLIRNQQHVPQSGSQPFLSLHGSRLDPASQLAAGYYQESPLLRGPSTMPHVGGFSGLLGSSAAAVRNAVQPPKDDMLGVGRAGTSVAGFPNLQAGVQADTCGSNQYIDAFLLGQNQRRRDLGFFANQSSAGAVNPFLLQEPSTYLPASLTRTSPGLRSSPPFAVAASLHRHQGEELRMPMLFPPPLLASQQQHHSLLQQHSSTRSPHLPLSSGFLPPSVHPPTVANQSGSQSVRSPTLYMAYDEMCLSKFQCLARKQIELFEATNDDVNGGAQGRNRPIILGQVGICCRHCSQLPPYLVSRTRGAVYFPTKLDRVYQTAVNMASAHLCKHCQHVPQNIRDELLRLKDQKSNAGGGKDYWASGIRMKGVVEAEDGGGLRLTEAGRKKHFPRRQQQQRL
jgi:hypothetical protein